MRCTVDDDIAPVTCWYQPTRLQWQYTVTCNNDQLNPHYDCKQYSTCTADWPCKQATLNYPGSDRGSSAPPTSNYDVLQRICAHL
jgi:hypothetical protein